MVFDRNNSALEFESTLRRHLKKSKGSVETSSSNCFGFDADLTSSYLEGAITGALKSSFEAHLAGCPDCRRHLIQLSRLIQQSGPETVQVPAGKRTDDWLSVLRDRFNWIGSQLLDLSSWQWNWKLAGTALAAFAVITTVVAIKPWRQADLSLASNTNLSGSAGQPLGVATETVAASQEPPPVQAESPDQPGLIAARVPRPDVRPSSTLDSQGVERILSRSSSENLISTLNARSESALFEQAAATRPQAVTLPPPDPQVLRITPVTPDISADLVNLEVVQEPDIAPRIFASPSDNPMRSVSYGTRRNSSRSREATLQGSRPGWYDRVMGFMPQQKAEKSPAKTPATPDESVAPLTRKVRDKSFRFERGIWIDDAYKPELMAWRIVKITQGNNEYDAILAAEPVLREFFSLGRVILVWKDKVYRVN